MWMMTQFIVESVILQAEFNSVVNLKYQDIFHHFADANLMKSSACCRDLISLDYHDEARTKYPTFYR